MLLPSPVVLSGYTYVYNKTPNCHIKIEFDFNNDALLENASQFSSDHMTNYDGLYVLHMFWQMSKYLHVGWVT